MTVKKVFLTLFAAIFCFSLMPAARARADVSNAISGERISGADRYETSVEISKFGWEEASDTAVIATGRDFPDALCAAPLAKKYNAPILLTEPDSLSQSLIDELTRLKTANVFIIGGLGVVSQNIEDTLKSMNINTTRLAGMDRYETSTAVAAQLGKSSSAVITTGLNFPDALSIASWAAGSGVPILLTEQESLPEPVAKYLKDNKIKSTYVIGGTGVVSDDVMSQLNGAKRIQGEDRYATNLAVLKAFDGQYDYSKIYLATGEDFPDALSGSALAALTDSPIILASPESLPLTRQYMDSNKDKLNEAYILGGEGAVSNDSVAGVIPPVVTGIKITAPPEGVGLNKKTQIYADITMLPSNAPKPDLIFDTENPEIVNLEPDGTANGLAPGTARITATAGGITSSTDIQVKLNKLIVVDPGHGGWSMGAIPTAPDGTKPTQYRESVLNLQISEKVRDRLQALGADVRLTRDGDTYASLEDREKLANDINADMFLSIHHDSAGNPMSSGTSAFYSSYKPGIDIDDVYVVADGTGPVYDTEGNLLGNLEDGTEYEYVKGDGADIYLMYNGSLGKTTTENVLVYDRTPSIVSQKSRVLADSINEGLVNLGLPAHGVKDKNYAVNMMTNCVSVLIEVGFLSNPIEFVKISQDSFQSEAADKIVQAIVDFYINEDDLPLDDNSSPATP